MKASELIGQRAIRTRHVVLAGGIIDRSMMEDPITILIATEHHIVCEQPSIFKGREPYQHVLSYEWNDDNWTSYDALMALKGSLPVSTGVSTGLRM